MATTLPAAIASTVSDLIGLNYNWDTNLLRQNLTPSSAIDAIKTPICWMSPNDNFY